MKMPWKLKLKLWLCKILGHRKEFSHHYGQDWYTCERCTRMVGEDE